MIKLFPELWYTLPIGWRRLLTYAPLAIGAVGFLLTFEWLFIAFGAFFSLVLFCLPGPSDAEKKGYHF